MVIPEPLRPYMGGKDFLEFLPGLELPPVDGEDN